MDSLGDIHMYLWQRLPLVLLFGGGYVVYQLMAATRLTDAFIFWILRKSHGKTSALILYIIAASAALSSFIPNTITVLTLLPVLKRLDNDFREQGVDSMTTVLMCAAIYGAAIGGMGSMIGSPANAILFGALDLFQVPGREQISFLNWFLWSVPLVALFVLAAWRVAAGLGVPQAVRGVSVSVDHVDGGCEISDRQRYGVGLFALYMVFWVLEGVMRQSVSVFDQYSPLLCLAFSVVFLFLVFVRPAPTSPYGAGPLLRVANLFQGIPRRGLMFMLLLGVLFGVVHWLKIDEMAVILAGELLQGDMPPVLLFFLTVLAVIFLTELLSNTAVVAAFFTIAYYAAQGHGMEPLFLMIGVGVASTCAFMTPIATSSNALAYGEMRGVSLRKMLGLGLVLNIVGAALLTVWLNWVLPLVY